MTPSTTQLFDPSGRRKYLTHGERERFAKVIEKLPIERKLFCQVLLYTGCRISEALPLTRDRIDRQERVLVLKTLKRRKAHQRAIPVPSDLAEGLEKIPNQEAERIWSFSRRTGWRIVKSAMAQAGIEGVQACPKGLRHAFGISCAENNVPLSLISTWMGHSSLQTTMIYLDAIGREERRFAKRTWLG